MEIEFRKWMSFYGKEHSDYTIEKGDFLWDTVKEKFTDATWVLLFLDVKYK